VKEIAIFFTRRVNTSFAGVAAKLNRTGFSRITPAKVELARDQPNRKANGGKHRSHITDLHTFKANRQQATDA
jgi:hypothetical protein